MKFTAIFTIFSFLNTLLPATVLAGTCDELSKNEEAPEQAIHYCAASKDAKKASDSQELLVPVWAAVGAVCGAACALEWAGGTAYCNAANWVGTGFDIGITYSTQKEFDSVMQSVGMTLGSVLLSTFLTGSGISAFGQTVANSGSGLLSEGGNGAACVIAGVSLLRAGLKYNEAKTLDGKSDEYEKLAGAYKGKNRATDPKLIVRETAGSSIAASPRGTNNMLTGGEATNGTLSSTSEVCGTPLGSATSTGILGCAAALDGSLPKGINSPEFADKFKELTKVDLADFVRGAKENGLSGAQGFGALASQGDMTAANAFASKFESEMAKLGFQPGNLSTGSVYAGGGSSGGSRSTASANPMASLFKNQGSPAAGAGSPSTPFAFGRTFDEIFADRKLNIFTRVTYRYQSAKDRLRDLPWSSQRNRAIANQTR